jgi:hypothetical protein
MRPTKFAIDFLEGKTFDGYTREEDWNGFACPYFSFEQAQHLIDAWHSRGWNAGYNKEADSFLFEIASGAGVTEDEIYSSLEIEGMKLYPIGAFNWIWDEVEISVCGNLMP